MKENSLWINKVEAPPVVADLLFETKCDCGCEPSALNVVCVEQVALSGMRVGLLVPLSRKMGFDPGVLHHFAALCGATPSVFSEREFS